MLHMQYYQRETSHFKNKLRIDKLRIDIGRIVSKKLKLNLSINLIVNDYF